MQWQAHTSGNLANSIKLCAVANVDKGDGVGIQKAIKGLFNAMTIDYNIRLTVDLLIL